MIRELSACCHQDRSRRKQAQRACLPYALKVRADEQFHKSGFRRLAVHPYSGSTPCIRPDETFDNERPPRNTEHQPGLSGGGPYEATLRARKHLPSEILDYALSCRCQVVGNSEFFGGVMLSTILLLG